MSNSKNLTKFANCMHGYMMESILYMKHRVIVKFSWLRDATAFEVQFAIWTYKY